MKQRALFEPWAEIENTQSFSRCEKDPRKRGFLRPRALDEDGFQTRNFRLQKLSRNFRFMDDFVEYLGPQLSGAGAHSDRRSELEPLVRIALRLRGIAELAR